MAEGRDLYPRFQQPLRPVRFGAGKLNIEKDHSAGMACLRLELWLWQYPCWC